MAEINCRVHIPEAPGLPSQQLTVGRHFIFQCSGELPQNFDLNRADWVLDEKLKHIFKLIRATKDESGLQLDCVSYVAGEVSSGEMTLSDGQQQVQVKVDQIKVESVLPQRGQTEKPPEPYGFMVSRLPWPWGYTAFFIVVFCFILSLIIWSFRRKARLRRLVGELKNYESALAADSQFYKQLRLLEKENYPAVLVEKQFRIYVIRKYQVPLFGMSINEAMKFLKKRWPTLSQERRELKNILMDLKKMSESSQSPADMKKYLNKLYQFIDQSEEKVRGSL